MPVKNRILKTIPLPRRGVNLFDTFQDIKSGNALITQNCFFRRGIQGRFGSVKHSTHEVVASKQIQGLHRFYYGTSSKQLLAACEKNISYMNDGTGVWTAIKTDRTEGAKAFICTWGAVNKAYIANGVDTPFSWDGTIAVNLTAFPDGTIMFLPYRDRILFIETANPSYLRWSKGDGATGDSYVDTNITSVAEALRIVGGGQIQVIAPHALAGTQEGINTMVFIATGSSCALFFADFLDPGSSAFDARLNHVSDAVGTMSPRSVVQTPIGTIFLGSDRQVYLLQYGTYRLQPIGTNIRSGTSDFDGIESIPTNQLANVCATYHDGFYKLAYATGSQVKNKNQMWLDILNIYEDNASRWGPWFGPMVGMPSVSCFASQTQAGDDLTLLGGNQDALGFVYQMDEPNTFSDSGTAISTVLDNFYQFFIDGDECLDVTMHRTEIEARQFSNTMKMSFKDTNGPVGSEMSLASSGTGTYFNEGYFSEAYYDTDESTVRIQTDLSESLPTGRQLSTVLQYASASDRFEIHVLRAEVQPTEPSFGGSL